MSILKMGKTRTKIKINKKWCSYVHKKIVIHTISAQYTIVCSIKNGELCISYIEKFKNEHNSYKKRPNINVVNYRWPEYNDHFCYMSDFLDNQNPRLRHF